MPDEQLRLSCDLPGLPDQCLWGHCCPVEAATVGGAVRMLEVGEMMLHKITSYSLHLSLVLMWWLNHLTALQTLSQLLLLHSPQEVHCDLHQCLPETLLLFILTLQHFHIFPLTLWGFWVIWTQNLLDLLQLLLHKHDNVVLQQLEQKTRWRTRSDWNHGDKHQIMLDRLTVLWSTKSSMEMSVSRTDVEAAVVHVQTRNMESRCVWCCWTDGPLGGSELCWSTLWRNHGQLAHICPQKDQHKVHEVLFVWELSIRWLSVIVKVYWSCWSHWERPCDLNEALIIHISTRSKSVPRKHPTRSRK